MLISSWQSWWCKKGGICIYYKDTLAAGFLQTELEQCLISDITFKNMKKGFLVSLYKSPLQTLDQFDKFLESFKELLQGIIKVKSYFVLITSDFNCRNSNWFLGDPATPQGALVESLTSFYELKQLIKTLTHLLRNSDTCIDLVFTKEPHESHVHIAPGSTCHHQVVVVVAKMNLKSTLFTYERVLLNNNKAENISINRSINWIDWEESFINKTVGAEVSEFNELLLNIYSNYIPNKTVLFEHKDCPWMFDGIKTAIKIKNDAYKELF